MMIKGTKDTKKRPAGEIFDLIPPQETISFMLKYSLHKQVTQIPSSVIVDREMSFELLQRALEIEIERNDCMRLRFFKEKGVVKQYFVDKAEPYRAPVMYFATAEEQEKALVSDTQKPVKVFKNEVFRVIFFRAHDGRYGVFFNVAHLIMDAAAVFLFYADLFAIYEALENGTALPAPLGSYRDAIKRDLAYVADEKRVAKDKAFYTEYFLKEGEPFYAAVHGPAMLEKERLKKKNPELRVPSAFDLIHDKANMIHRRVSKEASEKILDFCEKNTVSPECLIQFGMRTHVSKINYRNPDVYFMMLCNRRSTVADKRTGGTIAQPLPSRCVITEDKTVREALAQMYSVQSQLYRHSSYPYMASRHLVQQLFHYGMTASPASMMLSWFPLETDTMHGWKYEFKGYNLGRYVLPLYSFAMKSVEDGGLKFAYLYRENLISAQNIHELHDNTIKAILAAVENPDMTVGQLLDIL